MEARSPFSLLNQLVDSLGQTLRPPGWAIEEMQRRIVLLLNHVLMQEPQARERLTRQAGRVVEARWRMFVVRLVATPAGLLDLAPPASAADLTLTLAEESPWQLAQAALRGDKPPVKIAGDVQFAAEINWLVDHVRWDLEEDLSRLVGDGPAHATAAVLRQAGQALRRFVSPAPAGASSAGAATVAPGTAR